MKQLNIFDVQLAAMLREEGMKRVETKANKLHPGWSQSALDFVKRFCQENSGKTFMPEDYRAASIGHVPKPHDNRVWGPIARKAKDLGYMEEIKMGVSKTPSHHRGLARIYRSLL